MTEVASLIPIGAWDRSCAWSLSPESMRCVPLESQAYQGGPYLHLTSFWDSVTPKSLTSYGFRYKQARPSFELAIQAPKSKPGKRRRSLASQSQSNQRAGRIDNSNNSSNNDHAASSGLQSATNNSADSQQTTSGTAIAAIGPSSRSGDTLFSSIGVRSCQPYDTKNLCDLCRQPFEVDDDALHAHLTRHWGELESALSCNRCQISFSHKADLSWHLKSIEHRGRLDKSSRSKFCIQLRQWEQAQLHLHSQTIDKLCQAREAKRPARSSSMPPRMRMPLDPAGSTKCSDSIFNSQEPLRSHEETLVPDVTNSTTQQALSSLQQRIRDLMEQVQPNSPDEQDTPYSEFCDSHSLPGSPEQISKDVAEVKGDRARSEPPHRTCPNGECAKNTGSCGSGDNGATTSGGWNFAFHGQGQKRGNDGRDHGQYGDSDGAGNDGLQPKKRKTIDMVKSEVEKKFPCIFHIGEPVRFKDDVSRHQHISNMCRHLRSHSFYSCSTCILLLPDSAALDRHMQVGQHEKACSKKGCKRTKPAGHYMDPMCCAHIMNAEDQWHELFALQFNQQPPSNIFATASRTQSGMINDNEVMRHSITPNNVATQSSVLASREDSIGDFALTDSFFEQAMDFDLPLTPENIQSDTCPLDVTEFLHTDDAPVAELRHSNDAQTGAEAPVADPQLKESEKKQFEGPTHDAIAALQQQVAALERLVSSQKANEKDQILALREKVVHLEQKLYQSSEREQQLEATLSVIFEAFQSTGAPQAQPNKPLWKLFMSHSSQPMASATVNPEQTESLSPSLTFASKAPRTPPDSTYGSTK